MLRRKITALAVRHTSFGLYWERKIGWLLRDSERRALPARVAKADLELRQKP